MDYETGKNFEKVQALLEEHEQKLEYLMTKLAEKPLAKKPIAKPVEAVPIVEEEDEAIEDIVDQEYEEPTVKQAPKKKWGRKQEEDEEEEPGRIL